MYGNAQRLQLHFKNSKQRGHRAEHPYKDKFAEIAKYGVLTSEIKSVSCNLTGRPNIKVFCNVNLEGGVTIPTQIPLIELAELLKEKLPRDRQETVAITVFRPRTTGENGQIVVEERTSSYTLDKYCEEYAVR